MLIAAPLAWGASQENDIENRFIYSDYSQKISMDFKDVSLMDVLKILSKQSGMNFISAGDVSSKKITLFLDNIPIEEALDKILDANGLTYEMAPNSEVFIVKSKSQNPTITKVFPLKYATVSNSSLKGTTSGAGAAAGGITGAVKAILSKDGKLQEDPRTNCFIITDLPERFPLIEETISKLDVKVAQILIEVEILDVSKGAEDKIGISYGNGGPFVKVTGGTRTSYFPFNEQLVHTKEPSGSASSTSITTSASGTTTDGILWTPGTYDFTGMQASLDFLKTQNDTRSLARPRILTLNNQLAHIEILTDQATNFSQVTTNSTTNTGTITQTIERHNTGVTLDVTPQANIETGEITMLVTPSVIEAKTSSIATPTQPVEDVETRKSNSLLNVKDGETVIIGGLLRTQEQNTGSKLPFFGDLPLVGAAFRHKDKTSSERDLIIFITPHILDDKFKKKMDNEVVTHLNREVRKP